MTDTASSSKPSRLEMTQNMICTRTSSFTEAALLACNMTKLTTIIVKNVDTPQTYLTDAKTC